MKILILGINFAPEMISTGLYTTGMAEAMAQAGHQVEVVTAQPYYPGWKIFDNHSKYGWSRRRSENGVKVVHCPHYVPGKPSGLKRILHHFSFTMTALPVMLYKALRFRPDLVVCIEPALLPAPVGLLSAKLCGAKTWLHVQDFEVEAAFVTGLIKEKSLIGKLARKFDSWIHRRFDRVSSISQPMLQHLSAKGIPDARIFELRNWANLAAVKPLEGPSPYRETFAITRKHVAIYSGNIANKQGLEIIPEVARALQDRNDLSFVVCGDGPFLPELKRRAEGLDNIHFFPLQPIERLGDLLGLASVHLLPQIAGVADLLLPSKLTNMLASGIPTVATAEAHTSLAKAVEGCGLVVPPGNSQAMAQAIIRLLDNSVEARALGAAARDRALDQWDSKRIFQRLDAELRALVGTKASAEVPIAGE